MFLARVPTASGTSRNCSPGFRPGEETRVASSAFLPLLHRLPEALRALCASMRAGWARGSEASAGCAQCGAGNWFTWPEQRRVGFYRATMTHCPRTALQTLSASATPGVGGRTWPCSMERAPSTACSARTGTFGRWAGARHGLSPRVGGQGRDPRGLCVLLWRRPFAADAPRAGRLSHPG